ncbi:MAG TPA: hypothetical protein PLI22_06215, partial [Caldisericia bacterium]|nr:hypothetical protein [Caldisericia bacterium]
MKKRRIVLLSFIIIFSLLSIYIPKVYGGPATHFEIIVPSKAKIGVPFNITIKALDASGLLASPAHTGTVNLIVPSGFAIDPNQIIFDGSEGSQKTFSVKLAANDLANWTIITITAKQGSIEGTSSGFQVTGGNPAYFDIIPTSISGSSYSVPSTVTTGDRDYGLALIRFGSNEYYYDK